MVRSKDIPSMAKRNRTLVLSPHPDDAVWSLGGLVATLRSTDDVVIVTLFDGDPTDESLARSRQASERWRVFGDPAVRRAEDAKAAARLGCELVSLGCVDAALRLTPDGAFEQASLDTLWRPPEARSAAALLDHLEQRLGALLRPDDRLIAPLGFGGHIDHRITHELARRLGRPTGHYAEFPYYLPERAGELTRFIASLGLAPVPVVTPGDWPAWLEASRCYRSQILRMFGTSARFVDVLAAYASHGGAVPHCRIWSTASR
jgi:LmbE family N-acetylglucosaminyl deacetylase